MFGVFVVTVCLPLALGLPDAYGVPPPITADIPSQGIEPAVQAGVDHKLFFDNSQNQAQVKEVPSSPADQPEAASISSPLQYGVPSVDQTLKNSYSIEASVGQSAQENSDKALSYNSDRGNIEYLRSPQDVTNEELILSYRPEVVSMYDYDQDSGLEYARYAPSHSAKYVAGSARDSFHHGQNSPDVEYETQQYQRTPQIFAYNDDVYPSSRAQPGSLNEHNKEEFKFIPEEAGPKIPSNQNNQYSQTVQIYDAEKVLENPSHQPTYPNYQNSQHVQNLETQKALKNPSYLTSQQNYQYSQDEKNVETQKALTNPSHLSSHQTYQNSHDGQKFGAEKSLENPSYQTSNQNYQNSQDVRNFETQNALKNPSYLSTYQNYQYSQDGQNFGTQKSLENPSYQNYQNSQDVRNFETLKALEKPSQLPSYQNHQYLHDVQNLETQKVPGNPSYQSSYQNYQNSQDVQNLETLKALEKPSQLPSYQNHQYLHDVQNLETHKVPGNPSYQSSYQNYQNSQDLRNFETPKALEKPSQLPSYQNHQYLHDVQNLETQKVPGNPSYQSSYQNYQNSQDVQNLETLKALEKPSQLPSYQNHQYLHNVQNLETHKVPGNPSYQSAYQNYQNSQDVPNFEAQKPFKNPSYQFGISGATSQNTGTINPGYQTSKGVLESVSSNGHHRGDVSTHHSTDAQNTRFASGNYGTIASKEQKYGIPPVESSVFKNSQHTLPEYPPEVYNPVHPAHYDYSGHRHETTKNDYHHIPSALREQVKNNGGIGSYQSPPVPVRYIAVFQKLRAPGRADVSTASYTTQPVDLLQPALVLPPSNYQAHSPSGSISSTFISKDTYQRRPLFTQKNFKDGVQLEALSDGDVSNPLPQSSYGLPNF